ncbi:SH3 domain-containing protein [Streptomyces sp. AJS327]|uniref:SH3 domain-containing protein n=1 Tax=Streptomyces sp. AJS327 TaxID=2545265 RepID=UPI0015DF4A3C|nr:SH3 domain-containing protein [Streptomyces sp. AJS327]MBA0051658.1 SH3 domain-containing protein [Streptomyces sp. AJS327]
MFQSTLSKLSLSLAGGAVATVTAIAPATAVTHDAANTSAPRASVTQSTPQKGGDHRYYKGKVISKLPLMIRNKPNQHGKIIGKLRPGQIVAIICKVKGQVIDGNPRWYKLPAGGYAFASARYIKNIGPAPHWCKHHHH